MKVFARKRHIGDRFCTEMYYNYNIANAAHGFHEMGFEIIDYFLLNEIMDYYSRGDIILDGVDQVEFALNKFGIKVNNINYPDVLKKYLGRNIWEDTINHINCNPELWPVFVKPVKDKVFTGLVIRDTKDLIGCGRCGANEPVLCSDVVNFVFECRGFIYYDKMIDLRPYRGDWKYMKNMDTDLIDKAVQDFATWEGRPNACSLDFGVTDDGRTLLIEQNSAYALGCYGLQSIDYAKLISAYISQVFDIPDECQFTL